MLGHSPSSNGVQMADQSAIPWAQRDRARGILGGVSKSTFWRFTKEPDFPQPRYLTPTLKMWPEDELVKWRDARAAKLANMPRPTMPKPPRARRTAITQ
jgi:predicted DNA-binding transcriptional regulator AlpA